MTFSENNSLLPGGSVSASEVKKLNEKIDNLSQTVTSVADSVSALSNEVNTSSLNASNAVIDNATIGSETVSSADITDAEIESADITGADITNADITNAEIDEAEITSLTVTNEVAISVNSTSFTGQTIHVSDNIQTDKKLLGADVEATNAKFTNAEVTDLEIKGDTTVRGDVYFPENGDKIYGEYLEVDANEIKGKTVKAVNLTTETPSGTNNLVGYDVSTGKLIPVDASLDPTVLWEQDSNDQTIIVPKSNKNVKVPGLAVTGQMAVTNEAYFLDEVTMQDNLGVQGYATIGGDLTVNQNVNTDDLNVTTDATVGGDLEVSGDTTLTDTTVDGTLQVNGDIIQNGSAYETHAEKVYTKNDLIFTRDGAVSALSAGDFTGIQAEKYDGTNDGQLVFDRNGEARVGDVGDTEPLMTRDELANMTDGYPVIWDGTGKKAKTGSLAQKDALDSGITASDVTQIGDNETAIGDLSALTTTDKTDLVSAINEVSASIGTPDVSNVTGVLPIANGGTGASTKSVAKTNLGNYSGFLSGGNFNSSSITLTLDKPIGADNITDGDIVTVYVTSDVKSSVAVDSVYFSFAGGNEQVICGRNDVISHEYTSANPNYNASYPHVVFKAGTTLTLMYEEDARWYIIGNPEVDSYHDANGNGYVIKADGLIEQWGTHTNAGTGSQTFAFPVIFTSTPTCVGNPFRSDSHTDYNTNYRYFPRNYTTSQMEYYADTTNGNLRWYAKGY
jgi:uncharacterized protein YjbI with pentapeptide repeats